MARVRKSLPAKLDLAYLISAGVLAGACPRDLIDEVLAETGRASQRQRLLPAQAVVYYVMALAVWREAPLEEVLRLVCEGLQWLDGADGPAVLPTKSAISQARSRLGEEVMRRLAQRVLQPVATPETLGAWYGQWRVMAVDGTCLDVADEAANAEFFGYPGVSRGRAAFPQARVVSLLECGTHVVTAAQLGPQRLSEKALAAQLLPAALKPEMLLLADRNFFGIGLWRQCCASGAKLLWRVSSTLKLQPLQLLEDGSYLSEVFEQSDSARRRGLPVRVIEYTLEQSATPTEERYRLVTNILEPQQAPARDLAALYHERWEIESAFDEFKTHLRGHSTVVRSKTPELVLQEIWGLLLAHFAIRRLMWQAAGSKQLDPDRLSFTHAVRVVRRKMPHAAALPP